MRAAVAVAAAALLAALLYFSNMADMNDTPLVSLPSDPAGRRAAVRAALVAEGYGERQADILLGQAILETGNFKSQAFAYSLSPWNRHVGSGRNGDWNGRVYMDGVIYDEDAAALAVDPSNAREHLRCFNSLRQAVRDLRGLLSLSLYSEARAALDAGHGQAYAVAIARGNGNEGFVGPTGTTKAANYTAGLLSQFKALGVA